MHSLTGFIYHSDDKLAAAAINFIATAQSSAGDTAVEKDCRGAIERSFCFIANISYVNLVSLMQSNFVDDIRILDIDEYYPFFLLSCIRMPSNVTMIFLSFVLIGVRLCSDWFGFVWSRLAGKNLAPTRRALLQSITGRQRMMERIDLVGKAITLATTSKNINFGHLKVHIVRRTRAHNKIICMQNMYRTSANIANYIHKNTHVITNHIRDNINCVVVSYRITLHYRLQWHRSSVLSIGLVSLPLFVPLIRCLHSIV